MDNPQPMNLCEVENIWIKSKKKAQKDAYLISVGTCFPHMKSHNNTNKCIKALQKKEEEKRLLNKVTCDFMNIQSL